MTDREKLEAFMRDLKALCAKHNASFRGCGCCGSPYGDVGNVDFDCLDASDTEVAWHDSDGEHLV